MQGALRQGVMALIMLTKLNGSPIAVNSSQIEYIDLIPESKITMMNGKYHIVKETQEEIIEKIVQFNQTIFNGLRVEVK